MPVTLAALLAMALWFSVRERTGMRLRADRRRRFPVGRTGIVAGAESLVLDNHGPAVLLLHGFGDSPQSLVPVARALHSAGYAVCAPLLPGHGRTLEAFSESHAQEWIQEARNAYNAIAPAGPAAAVVGVSMGAALACDLVASLAPDRAPHALVLITPYLHLTPKARVLTSLWPVWSVVQPWVRGDRNASIRDPQARARSLGYGVATPRLLRELRTVVERGITASPRLHLPTLAIFSRNDYRISIAAADASFLALGGEPKEMRWVSKSGHVVTVDFDADAVAAMTVEWIRRHAAPR